MKRKRKVLLISTLILLFGGAITGYALYARDKAVEFNEQTNKEGGANKPESQDGTKLKEDGTPIPSTSPDQPGTSTNSNSKLRAIITLTVAEQIGSNATVRARVDRGGGTCRLVFEKSGYPAQERTAPVILTGQIYGCQGFDIPVSEFPVRGSWSAKVFYNSDTHEGESETREINLN